MNVAQRSLQSRQDYLANRDKSKGYIDSTQPLTEYLEETQQGIIAEKTKLSSVSKVPYVRTTRTLTCFFISKKVREKLGITRVGQVLQNTGSLHVAASVKEENGKDKWFYNIISPAEFQVWKPGDEIPAEWLEL